ncbi:putative 2-oxo-4-hydroxy-4-carboxy-5-ureidoimidazoline decarboxylase [Lynx canadensis]|uniref:putative 2-oxo-4-hydroxy-4-carboxy-5-ureidoimidazoline decarboxylase n=1 Tax=Lynx canadensis TaxID=61383 RepID=UPI0011B027D5|nr:putative 2-oxo-4-hydroxy-4-carboxy-5-ureidoimidazoline decarboxylase [Lynx canadensis]
MDMEKVNSMDFGEFVDVFGNVVERCPLIAAAVWSQRPFSNSEDLEKHFFAFIDALPQSDAPTSHLGSQNPGRLLPSPMDVIPVGPSPPFSFGTERNPFGGSCRKSSGPRVRPSPTSKPLESKGL